ncbi:MULTISPECIES: hypothetical protein [Streptomyces]|uniref:Nitrogen fixation protein n=1 Tax=Streptomyces nymphaeiformis TaxID=2663842 RepID=A0A7W7TXC4_9ACTN|nr:hypothetical protein [Streptomyces nymphaeiformis]MBB4981114.1 hypothetical protein [Streptomyces nymphaeiformis]
MPQDQADDGAELLCPSAPADAAGAVLIGVVAGTPGAPRVTPTAHAMPVTLEITELARPASSGEVFRVAAPCRTSGCAHFKKSACQIASRSAVLLDEVVSELPRCPIRAQCRWFHQEGPSLCRRCPQIVTEQHRPSSEMLRIVNETDPPPGPSAGGDRGPSQ